MKPKRIILIRHGHSAGNENKELYKTIPDYAVLLTEKGRQDASEVGNKINSLIQSESFCAYYSPYFRSRQTMDIAFKNLNINNLRFKREEPRIREQEYSGKLRDANNISSDFEKEREDYGKFFYRLDGGESVCDCYDRVSSFIGTLYRHFNKHDYPENCLIFTHGMLARVFVQRWFHIEIEEFETWKNPKNGEFYIMELGVDGKYKLINPPEKHKLGYGYKY